MNGNFYGNAFCRIRIAPNASKANWITTAPLALTGSITETPCGTQLRPPMPLLSGPVVPNGVAVGILPAGPSLR